MAAPVYLTPQYITYAMIEAQLTKVINVTLVDSISGMSLGQVNDYMARAEANIIQSYLANYVAVPLQTINSTSWDNLLNNTAWYETYSNIKSLFIANSFYYIFYNYFSFGGEGNNGLDLIKNALNQVNIQANLLLRVDQAGNPLLKNCFIGLKPCPNFTQRIAQSAKVPNIPTGQDQAYMAINSVPNYKFGFNK